MDYHFSHSYAEFERLTMYPKFRVGLGHPAYLNPIRIFEEPIRCNFVSESDIRRIIPESMQLFVEETEDFFKRHLKQISAGTFFNFILTDPDVGAGWVDNKNVDAEALTLKRLVARELGKSVTEGLNRK